MTGIAKLLPLTPGDIDLLRLAILRMRAFAGRSDSGTQTLLMRLTDSSIDGEELDLLRRLVENERTLRRLIVQQQTNESESESDASTLRMLEALRAKLDGAAPFDR